MLYLVFESNINAMREPWIIFLYHFRQIQSMGIWKDPFVCVVSRSGIPVKLRRHPPPVIPVSSRVQLLHTPHHPSPCTRLMSDKQNLRTAAQVPSRETLQQFLFLSKLVYNEKLNLHADNVYSQAVCVVVVGVGDKTRTRPSVSVVTLPSLDTCVVAAVLPRWRPWPTSAAALSTGTSAALLVTPATPSQMPPI